MNIQFVARSKDIRATEWVSQRFEAHTEHRKSNEMSESGAGNSIAGGKKNNTKISDDIINEEEIKSQ